LSWLRPSWVKSGTAAVLASLVPKRPDTLGDAQRHLIALAPHTAFKSWFAIAAARQKLDRLI